MAESPPVRPYVHALMELLDEARLRVPRFLPLEYHRLAEEVARTPSDAPSALRGYVTAGVQAPEEFEFVTDRQSLRRTIHPWVEEARSRGIAGDLDGGQAPLQLEDSGHRSWEILNRTIYDLKFDWEWIAGYLVNLIKSWDEWNMLWGFVTRRPRRFDTFDRLARFIFDHLESMLRIIDTIDGFMAKQRWFVERFARQDEGPERPFQAFLELEEKCLDYCWDACNVQASAQRTIKLRMA